MLETDFARKMVARIEGIVPKAYDGSWLDDALCDLLEDASNLARMRLMHHVETIYSTFDEDWKLSHVCTLSGPAATEVLTFTRRTYEFPMIELTSAAICKDSDIPAKIQLGDEEVKISRIQLFEELAEFCDENKRVVSSSFLETSRYLSEQMIAACGMKHAIWRGPQTTAISYPHYRFRVERTNEQYDYGAALLITAPARVRGARFTPGQKR